MSNYKYLKTTDEWTTEATYWRIGQEGQAEGLREDGVWIAVPFVDEERIIRALYTPSARFPMVSCVDVAEEEVPKWEDIK